MSTEPSWFAAMIAISIILAWSPLLQTMHLALDREEYTHLWLILPVSIALIAMDWKHIQPVASFAPRAGGPILLLAGIFAASSKFLLTAWPDDVRLSLAMFAAVLWWIASFVLCFGVRASRKALFALAFLLWLVPWPQFVLDAAIHWLQVSSARVSTLLFEIARVPVSREALLIHLPGLTLRVARECSSIRSSLLLLVVTMLLAHLYLRSAWRKAAVSLLAIPLAAAKNGLRIFTIGFLSVRVDPSFMQGEIHHKGGFIFLAIALAVVALLIWALHRGEATRGLAPGVRLAESA